jgi:hypothetical protein
LEVWLGELENFKLEGHSTRKKIFI